MAKHKFLPLGLPKVSVYARDKQRPHTKYFRLKKSTLKVKVDDLEFSENDPRNEDMDWKHVDDIYTNLLEAGYDEDGKLPAVIPNKNGKYYIIDNHHLIAALKKLGQEYWYVDVYEYTGIDPEFIWSAATDFGFSINNSHNPVKKTTMASVVNAGVQRIKEKGYIYEPGTPVDETYIDMWLRETKQHEVFAPVTITKLIKQIQHPNKLAGKKIRNLSTEEVRDVVFASTHNYYGSGILTGGRKGYVVCTNTFGADAPKWWNQVLNAMDDGFVPVIQTYSTKDDPATILKNHKEGFERLYEQFVRTTRIMSNFYPSFNGDNVLSRKEFYDKIEYVAMGQLDGEYIAGEDDVITRPVF